MQSPSAGQRHGDPTRLRILNLLSSPHPMILDQEKRLENLGVEVMDLGCHISVPTLLRRGVIGQGLSGWTSSAVSLYRDIGLNPYNLARSIYLTSFVYLLAKLKREPGFQLLHAHWAYPAGYIGHLLKKREGVKLVISVYGYDVEKQSERYRFTLPLVSEALRDADRVIAFEQTHYDTVVRILGAEEKVELMRIPIDTQTLRPPSAEEKADTRRWMGFDPSDKIILFGPRMEAMYRPLDLVNALASIIGGPKDMKVVFLGQGELENEVRRQVSRKGIPSLFPGTVSYDKMRSYYWGADLYCNICVHGQGVSTLEALSCGIPAIGYRGSQLKIVDKKDGILLDGGDTRELAQAVSLLLDNKELAEGYGSEGRRKVQAENDSEACARSLVHLYSGLITEADIVGEIPKEESV